MIPTVYQSFIHRSRYARYLPEKNRRENWEETVNRYLDFMTQHLQEKHSYDMKPLRKELYDSIYNFQVMPSMRAIMTAGKALERDSTCSFNCLGGETLVTTKEYGIIPIKELEGKKVHIVDGNGDWTLAECKSYGEQKLYNVEFGTSGKGKFSIRSTDNHRWIQSNGKEVLTKDLAKGMSLATICLPKKEVIVDEYSIDYKMGIQHGIIYGDGTASCSLLRSKKNTVVEKVCNGFIIRLCSKSRELLKYFDNYTHSFPKSFNGDPVVYIFDRATDLKSLPNSDIYSYDYLCGFLRGWMASDGSITTSSQISLSGKEESIEWLMKNGVKFGFVVRNTTKDCRSTNFGERKSPLFRVELDRRYMEKDDFILDYKKERFSKIDTQKNPGFGKVRSVSSDSVEKVYCFEVPTTHSFMLTKNLLTGNCAYLQIDDPKAFDEAMFILLCGSGVGFSVERQFINQLPEVPEKLFDSETTIVVKDSKEGWAKSLRMLIALLYSGEVPKWDTSKVRPAGAILKTFGGRASGPQPLEDLFKFTVKIFKGAKGRKLTSLECHDLMCKIAEVVVVGGVRRAAMISLSNLSDDRMRHAKSGSWWEANPQRALSNNSAVYNEKPEVGIFMREWLALYDSKSGERGIFNRESSDKIVERSGRRETGHLWGTNPCSEIIMRSNQFCNLTEPVIRSTDSFEDIMKKIRIAAILGTFQSTLTHFPYLRKIWQKNTEEERLLGLSLTGIYDNPLFNNPYDKDLPYRLDRLREYAIEINKEFANILDIPQSVAITCVKPSGTVSQLVDSASGIHPRHSKYYIRRVRADNKDPLTQFMKDEGIPWEPEYLKPETTSVFSFPIKSPEGSVFKDDIDAISHLELWLIYQKHWCEHKPSVTISVKEEEWPRVGAWIYDHFDEVSGISFLPYDGGTYRQAPFEECNRETYEKLLQEIPLSVEWDNLIEEADQTEGVQMLACTSGSCELAL